TAPRWATCSARPACSRPSARCIPSPPGSRSARPTTSWSPTTCAAKACARSRPPTPTTWRCRSTWTSPKPRCSADHAPLPRTGRGVAARPLEAEAHPRVPEPARQVVGRGVVAVERAAQADRRILGEHVVDAAGEAEVLHPRIRAPGQLRVMVGGGTEVVAVVGAVVADVEAVGAGAGLAQAVDVARGPARLPAAGSAPDRGQGRGAHRDGAVVDFHARRARLGLAGLVDQLV